MERFFLSPFYICMHWGFKKKIFFFKKQVDQYLPNSPSAMETHVCMILKPSFYPLLCWVLILTKPSKDNGGKPNILLEFSLFNWIIIPQPSGDQVLPVAVFFKES